MKLTTKDTMTSLEVLEQINLFREKEDKHERSYEAVKDIMQLNGINFEVNKNETS